MSKKTRAEVAAELRAARALLTDAAWIRNASARGEAGELVLPEAPWAAKFCAAGAIRHVTADWCDALGALNRALPAAWLARPLDPRIDDPYRLTLPRFNDDPSTTLEDVLGLFDRAIAAQGEIPGRAT